MIVFCTSVNQDRTRVLFFIYLIASKHYELAVKARIFNYIRSNRYNIYIGVR
jgi:hypothetical protein